METRLSAAPHQVKNYSFEFEFESRFDYHPKLEWMTKYWQSSFALSVLYVACVFLGQKLMKERNKFELRKAIFLWNLALAVFSITGAIRTAPELVDGLKQFGFRYTLCNNSSIYYPRPVAIWSWLFIISKVPELGDTAFIVLRKQRLIFLHWFHHATVLIYCFYSYFTVSATGRWFIVMNYTVHAFMYSYFALKALSFRIPRVVNVLITAAQLSQMFVGCYINYSAYQYKMADQNGCWVSLSNIKASFLMYTSYFFLFSWFFYNSYLRKQSRQQRCLKTE